MRVFIDYDADPEFGGIQVIRDDISGQELAFEDLVGRIVVDVYEDKYNRVIMVLTNHTFEDQSK